MIDLPRAHGAAAAAAQRWRLAEPTLLRHGMNAIFVADEVILRVGHPTADPSLALAVATVLRERNLAVPAPARPDALELAGFGITAWERLVPVADPVDWYTIGQMVRRAHEIPRSAFPAGYPVPSPVSFPWWDFDALIDDSSDQIDDAAVVGLAAAVARRRDWAGWDEAGAVVCHGDVHPGNVLATRSGPVLLDWDLMCRAPAAWDHGPLMTVTERWGGAPEVYEHFAAGYGWSGRDDSVAESFAELRLVAATLLCARAARSDATVRPELERRLRFWRSEPDAPPWRAR